MNETGAIEVETGQVKVAKSPARLRCSALGSCVAVFLWDSLHKIGGAAHVMLPSDDICPKGDNSLKYARHAIETLIKEMLTAGASRELLRAKIVGGALVVKNSPDIGLQNIEAVTRTILKNDIKIVGRRVGGFEPMRAELDPATGLVRCAESGGAERVI